VGDIAGNEQRIAEVMTWAAGQGADVLLLPELAINGYPPEDLVLRPDFVEAGLAALDRLAVKSGSTTVIVGFVDRFEGPSRGGVDAEDRTVANAAAVLQDGAIAGVYHKVLLPNYGVFDEDRYFAVGQDPARTWKLGEIEAGVSICEDIWRPDGPPRDQALAGAQLLLNINASPFHKGKAREREAMIVERARDSGVPVVYLNLVGGQDELVFDGCSLAVAADGTIIHRSPQFEEDTFVLDLPLAGEKATVGSVVDHLGAEEEVYRALQTGLGDYVRKNGFEQVLIGLSGGIDSALTAVIAADTLGPEAVWGVAMPSRFSSQHSIDDARVLAERLGIRIDLLPIDGVYSSFLDALDPVFAGTQFGTAEENLQARTRGAILMAISNKHGPMVVATGNKSEMAAGYSTLYGDMVGGYAVLKDVFKTLVYDLSRWRNKDGEVIPQSTIDKPPSAELRPNQKDSDSLPPYEVLDEILALYVEADLGVAQIVDRGFDPGLVSRVAGMVDRNEYKRRQAAPGVKITVKAFGKDRRLPITNRHTPRSG
jgi:NAD+ synthase (glutamine-hydrolysing)